MALVAARRRLLRNHRRSCSLKRSGDTIACVAVDEVQPTMPLRTRMFMLHYAMVSIASYDGDVREEVFTGFAVVSSRTACILSDVCLCLCIT